jgi:23S rRNA pseudouridine1911/1915/1917 synthase
MKSIRRKKPSTLLTQPLYRPRSELTHVEGALYSSKHRITAQSDSPTLFSLLSSTLPHISADSWRERANFGGLYVNGSRVVTDQAIPAHSIVEYYEPRYDYCHAEDFYPSFNSELIAYEDEYVAILFKPAGLPTHPNKEQTRFSLKTYAEKHYKRSVHLPSRLDTATAGLVPMSINLKMHQPLQRLFERRLVKKSYLCAIQSDTPLQSPVRIDCGIGRNALHPVLREAKEDSPSRAITDIAPMTSSNSKQSISYLLAMPITGRTHQIRVHCASFLGPIVGDKFYGGIPSDELHLMCIELSFFHPFQKNEITVRVPQRLIPGWAQPALS